MSHRCGEMVCLAEGDGVGRPRAEDGIWVGGCAWVRVTGDAVASAAPH